MIGNVILTDTKKEEWDGIKSAITERILKSMGKAPVNMAPVRTEFKETGRYEKYGLIHIEITYHVVDNEWNKAICILPEGASDGGVFPAVLTIHGTNGYMGKYGTMKYDDPGNNFAYAIELAKRGYVTFAADQYGFGERCTDAGRVIFGDELYRKYPDWSLDGIHLLEQIRAIDVLEQLEFVKKGFYGATGISLGGRTVIYLTSLDRRIRAAVCSAGISPNVSNVYRLTTTARYLSPRLYEDVIDGGRISWEYNEMIALCAPRALLCLEPHNDPYNPDAMCSIQCIYQASKVYELLDVPDRINMIIHGDGHDTIPQIREYAYGWFDRFLKVEAAKPFMDLIPEPNTPG